jgi:proline iminopeptidase
MFPVEWQVFVEHFRALRSACGLDASALNAAQKALGDADELEPNRWQDILGVFYHALRHGDAALQKRAALAWGQWEQSIMSLQGAPSIGSMEHLRNFEMGLISCHLFLHDPVLNGSTLWEQMPVIASIPCDIVQGQFDAVTPAQTAWKLSQVLNACRLQLIRQAGHASTDPELTRALVGVLDSWVF